MTDVWTACQIYPPPRDLGAVKSDMDIDLPWVPIPDVPGFDPDGGFAFYQLGASPQFDSVTSDGANDVLIPDHRIPWERHLVLG